MKLKSITQSKKVAVMISYLIILANTFSNLLLTPMYLKYLGIERYGLYQMVYSVAQYILILDFGISTTMVRYISMYHAHDDYESESNFASHCLTIVISVIIVVGIIGTLINSNLLKIYPSITKEEASTAHTIFSVMVLTIAITIIEHFLQGIIMAYEHFSIVRLISLLKIISKVVITIAFLLIGLDVISIVISDLLVALLSISLLGIYSFGFLRFKIRLTKFSKVLFLSILSFMFAIFLQSVVSYVNNVVDKTILGIMTTKKDVAVYSVALTFITLFNSLPSAISGVFLPQATRLVSRDADRDSLTKFVVRPGRYQFMICGAVIIGFIILGKDFIILWAGKNTIQAWAVALIIMIPNMIPLIENTIISILDAKKKRLFRSIVLLGISIVNVIVSIILVSKYGMMGAPIGTAFSFVVGYGLVLNIYYDRIIGVNVVKMFKQIFSKIWICLLLTAAVMISIDHYLIIGLSWISLIIKGILFCVIYGGLLLVFGLNEEEKKDIIGIFAKFVKIRK